ncbi:MAG: beta-galactosidase [Bacteroidota bacterium]
MKMKIYMFNQYLKCLLFSGYLLFFISSISFSQNTKSLPDFKISEALMPIGAYYYPEHWSSTQWSRDIKRMADLGFTFTHFAEFAWAQLEPEEGKFDFDWLDECIATAAKNGLKVILCTPSPTPPAWLTEKHPEILTVNANGITQMHGSRLHVSYNHKTYLYYVGKIVKEMAERYGDDERVWGWQLDNEPHYGVLYDYSPAHEKEFQNWLKNKYLHIDSLNQAWGTTFWSQVYNHFEQIHIPNAAQAPQGVNPHALLDFQKFNAAELAEALRYQAEILREKVNPSQWITTNYAYFKFLPSVDPFLNKEDLDFASHTMYLTSGFLSDHGSSLSHRLGSGMELSFSQEFAESINGATGIMELQPGQINWGVINPQPLPGAVRMWVWHTFALGDQFACTYRFRQPLFGGEQTHKGIMDTDGITVARGGKEYLQVIKEINNLPKTKKAPDIPTALAERKTAFLWNQYNLLDLENHKHHADWNTWQVYYSYYQALKSMGSPVTFLSEDDTFDANSYPFMEVPAYQIVSKSLVKKWEKYVNEGGHLIISTRTGLKNPKGHFWETKQQEPIWNLIGAEIKWFDHLPASYPGKIEFENNTYNWHVWADVLIPNTNTEVWASHADQFYEGKAVATHKKAQRNGSVTYIGAVSDDGMLEKNILRKIFSDKGAEILDMPYYTFTEWRDGFWVTVNYTSTTITAPISENANIIYGEKSVAPGGVVVWQE